MMHSILVFHNLNIQPYYGRGPHLVLWAYLWATL